MGGYGSGRWYRSNTKTLVTSYYCLDISLLREKKMLQPGISGTVTWHQDERQQASIRFHSSINQLTLMYRYRHPSTVVWEDGCEAVNLDWTSCNYGGHRPWFICPGRINGHDCGRRVAKLYGGRYFLCRYCHNLAYPSQNVAVADRPLSRTQIIRRQLGGSPSLLAPFPGKPKNMHWAKYWQLRERAKENELEALTIMQRWIDQHRAKIDS